MKKRILCLCLTVVLCLCCSSCGKKAYKEDTFFGMDTFVTLKIDQKGDVAENIFSGAREILSGLEKEFSRHTEDSTVYKFNNSKDGVFVSSDFKELVQLSESISVETDMAFTITLGALTELWEKGEEENKVPTGDECKAALMSVGSTLEFSDMYLKKTNEDVVLEFGAVAKGYACEKLVEYMKENGSESGMVSFTSTIGVFGSNPSGENWKIAIKNPKATNEILGHVSLADAFLSVSGDYARFYEIGDQKYTHILDTKTGQPVNNGVHSVAVVAKSGALSDALATAFFAMGPEKVLEKYKESEDICVLFVTDEGIVMNSSMEKIYK